MNQHVCLRILVSLVVACSLFSADVTFATPGWEERSGKDAQATFVRSANQVELSVNTNGYARCEIPFAVDGTDAAPLRIETRVFFNSDGAQGPAPSLMTLAWPGAMIAIGVVPGEGDKAQNRIAVARWVNANERGEKRGEFLYPYSVPAFLRLVVSSHDVSAWASGDGWTWQRLATLPRVQGGFAGLPVKLSVGRGWPDDKQGLSLDSPIDDKIKPATTKVTFVGLRSLTEAATLPSSLLKTYSKGASREETLDQILDASQVRQWWIAGPFPARKDGDLTPIGPEGNTFDPAATFAVDGQAIGWKEYKVGDGPTERIVVASSVVPGEKGQVRFATTDRKSVV